MVENLQVLEREVEAARAKLNADLSVLRAPSTVSEFTKVLKQEAYDAKDTVVEKAKSSAMSWVEGLVTDLKAKAAANPSAALAIGAGVAWRLLRHPPIATALVGAGLVSLFRTTPIAANGMRDIDYVAQAKWRLQEQASDLAESVKERAVETATSVKDHAEELADTVTDKVQQWRGDVASNMQRPAIQTAVSDQAARDRLLLAAAGTAVAAAVGIAWQRRAAAASEQSHGGERRA